MQLQESQVILIDLQFCLDELAKSLYAVGRGSF